MYGKKSEICASITTILHNIIEIILFNIKICEYFTYIHVVTFIIFKKVIYQNLIITVNRHRKRSYKILVFNNIAFPCCDEKANE